MAPTVPRRTGPGPACTRRRPCGWEIASGSPSAPGEDRLFQMVDPLAGPAGDRDLPELEEDRTRGRVDEIVPERDLDDGTIALGDRHETRFAVAQRVQPDPVERQDLVPRQAGPRALSLHTSPRPDRFPRERAAPRRRGVPVVVATDFNPGSAPSFHLPLAMTLACINQSMTPQEALNGATSVAARALARNDRIGSLLPGYRADFAIIDSPALNHWLYHFVPNACVAVFKNGRAC